MNRATSSSRSRETGPSCAGSREYLIRFCFCRVAGCTCHWRGRITEPEFLGEVATSRRCPGCRHEDVGFFTRADVAPRSFKKPA